MKCPKCGNTDINEFVVFFIKKGHSTNPQEKWEDATTLPRFLFEMKKDNNFKQIEKIMCDADKKIKGKIFACGTEVKPTKFRI
jgi:hypothetical protein